ncbi:hypothetical protein ACEN9X_20900 [Mucilaginibacter sp. Mucisp86]|uniref:hypothetical protein n=1 Tax=Mucilaginibacter sp. Mucisp86 TaxID=3243060 RepID=UPI0039B4B4D2
MEEYSNTVFRLFFIYCHKFWYCFLAGLVISNGTLVLIFFSCTAAYPHLSQQQKINNHYTLLKKFKSMKNYGKASLPKIRIKQVQVLNRTIVNNSGKNGGMANFNIAMAGTTTENTVSSTGF